MATIGQSLTAPEAGWKRFDDSNTNITYTSGWGKYYYSSAYQGSAARLGATGYNDIKFNFTGTKLRIIGCTNSMRTSSINVLVDGILAKNYSQISPLAVNQTLDVDIQNLSNTEHYVQIIPQNTTTTTDYYFDAVDIDENGELRPYNPKITSAPTNLTATPGDAQVTLNWDVVIDAIGYNIKRSTTAEGPYTTTVASNVSGTSYVDTNVVNGTIYYYVVTAVNTDGESANSNEASATPQSLGKVLLLIELTDGLQKEYELTKSELDTFVNWYNNRSTGAGQPYYIFDKSFNLGPFDSLEDYLAFDKIQNFEVMKFTKQ
ncbi:fibronectin type III domain-containing protein [Propionispora hippei]|uniref:Fibronectin type-III domain-containing protein n=1 Tax=Propionispora hippei DSM 15287 TaxID=1123003 RepID=A0A1M6CYC2_9FIRM|nr:fibronectin type III domain-containing protein [Propionispora hippei]SHI65986.1 hypothetical protein SAMN02745170_00783 [Propionispora hippei DSM 15287]